MQIDVEESTPASDMTLRANFPRYDLFSSPVTTDRQKAMRKSKSTGVLNKKASEVKQWQHDRVLPSDIFNYNQFNCNLITGNAPPGTLGGIDNHNNIATSHVGLFTITVGPPGGPLGADISMITQG